MKEVAWYLFLLGSFGRLRMRPSCSSGDCARALFLKVSLVVRAFRMAKGAMVNGRLRCSLSRMRKKLSSWIHVRSTASTLALRCSVYVIQT